MNTETVSSPAKTRQGRSMVSCHATPWGRLACVLPLGRGSGLPGMSCMLGVHVVCAQVCACLSLSRLSQGARQSGLVICELRNLSDSITLPAVFCPVHEAVWHVQFV